MSSARKFRVTFAVSYFGSVVVGGLSWSVGNNWVFVLERTAAAFMVVFLMTLISLFVIEKIAPLPEQGKGNQLDLRLMAEKPDIQETSQKEPSEKDFVPWIKTAPNTSASNWHEQEKRSY